MIKGAIDKEGRCGHYHSPLDIIAIRLKCCNHYYACIYCHQENEHHAPEVWQKNEFTEKAVMCGHCNTLLTIHEYLASGNRCPACNAAFNPACANHYHYYFDMPGKDETLIIFP